jgi:hypothetical protein
MSTTPNKLTLQVPEDLVILVKKQALDEGISVSGLVRGLFEQWINKEIATPQSAKDEGKDTLSNRGLAGLIAS